MLFLVVILFVANFIKIKIKIKYFYTNISSILLYVLLLTMVFNPAIE
jgi:hypothetical protein